MKYDRSLNLRKKLCDLPKYSLFYLFFFLVFSFTVSKICSSYNGATSHVKGSIPGNRYFHVIPTGKIQNEHIRCYNINSKNHGRILREAGTMVMIISWIFFLNKNITIEQHNYLLICHHRSRFIINFID